ncbi:hypothetical protein [Paenibacillus peoriae]|uniref:hypothetical protein n=1 Tax=Paenibacillus peoriae TaxID=59893 RepID=UPI00096CB7EF|nr:hypothetical protein [Paenibacillus peoriae]OMF31908.1 hypothetical protein BK134_12590 [Paenibacillus peoriae]
MDDFSIILAQKERFGKIILIIQVVYYNFIKISVFYQQTAITGNKLHIDEFVSGIDKGFSYTWGTDLHLVHAKDRFINTIGFEDRYKRQEFKLLTDFALAELARDYEEAKTSILEVIVSTKERYFLQPNKK